MAARTDKDVSAIMADGTLVDAALAAGVREALLRYCRAGQPAVEWRDGKSVWLTPAEIQRRLEQMDKKKDS